LSESLPCFIQWFRGILLEVCDLTPQTSCLGFGVEAIQEQSSALIPSSNGSCRQRLQPSQCFVSQRKCKQLASKIISRDSIRPCCTADFLKVLNMIHRTLRWKTMEHMLLDQSYDLRFNLVILPVDWGRLDCRTVLIESM